MDLSTKILKDVALTIAAKASLKARGLVLIPVLTLFIGVAEYGAFVQVTALSMLAANVCSLRLDSGYVRYIHKTDRPERLYSSLVLLGTVVAVLGGVLFAMAAGPLAEYTLQDRGFATLFALGGAFVPVKCLYQFGRGYFRAKRRIRVYSLLEAITVYGSIGAIAIAVLVLETRIVGAFAAFLAAHTLVVATIYGLIAYDGGLAHPKTTGLYECLRFSIGSMGHLLSQSLLDKMDRVLLGFFIGASAVGVYSVAYSVAYLMLLYFRPLSISFFPEFSKLWEEDEYETIRRYTTAGIRFIAILGLPSIAGLWLIGDAVLRLISTADVATDGLVPLVLLATGMLAKGVGEIYAQLFFAANDSKTPALVQGGAVIANVLLNLLLIPSLGISGAALATLVSFTTASSVLYAGFHRFLAVTLPWKTVGRATIATAGMTTLMIVFGGNWILTVAIAPVIYVSLLFTIGEIRASEIRFIVESVR